MAECILVGNGGGSGYHETVLYNTWTAFAVNDTITLADDVDKFDAIIIYTNFYESTESGYYTHYSRCIIPKNDILISLIESSGGKRYSGYVDLLGSIADCSQYYMCWSFNIPNKTTLKSTQKKIGGWAASQCGIYKIVGVNY